MRRISPLLALLLTVSACAGSAGAAMPNGARECDADEGSPTDLQSQPEEWLDYGTYLRWTDADGCLVRIDVISHHFGGEHCDLQTMQSITIGRPFGTSIAAEESRAQYLWDPERAVPDGPLAVELRLSDIPESAFDTGFRRNDMQLWLDETDESVILVIDGDVVQVWKRSELGICA